MTSNIRVKSQKGITALWMSLHMLVHHSLVIKGAGGMRLSPWAICFDTGSSVNAACITPQRFSRTQWEEIRDHLSTQRTSKPQSAAWALSSTGFTPLTAVIRQAPPPLTQWYWIGKLFLREHGLKSVCILFHEISASNQTTTLLIWEKIQ